MRPRARRGWLLAGTVVASAMLVSATIAAPQPERSLLGVVLGRPFSEVLRRFGTPSQVLTVTLSTGGGAPQIPGFPGGPGGFSGEEGFPGGYDPAGGAFGGPGGNGPGAAGFGGGAPFGGGPVGAGMSGAGGFGAPAGFGPAAGGFGGGAPFGGAPFGGAPFGGGAFGGPGGGRRSGAGGFGPGGFGPGGFGGNGPGGNGPGGGGFPSLPPIGGGMGAPFGGDGMDQSPGFGGESTPDVSSALLWRYNRGSTRIEFLINEDGRVAQISVAAPLGRSVPLARTSKGITLGSSYTAVLNAYQFPEQTKMLAGGRYQEAWYSKDYRAAFTFDNTQQRVVRITIALQD